MFRKSLALLSALTMCLSQSEKMIPITREVTFNYDPHKRPGHGGNRYFPPGLNRKQVEEKYPDYPIRARTLRFPNADKKLIWLVRDESGHRFQVPRQN